MSNEKNLEEICSEIIVICPHCNIPVIIEKLNCRIFRHGIIIQTGKQINPHASKKECDEYVSQQLIYGCGKPFKILKQNDEYKAFICDYI